MDHPTRDSGLALGHEGERQQDLHSTEQRRHEQSNDEEETLYTEQQQQQDTEGGGSVRLGTATRGETIGHEDDAGREPRLERAQSPASDLARRERELPRVPPYYAGSIADSQIQQSVCIICLFSFSFLFSYLKFTHLDCARFPTATSGSTKHTSIECNTCVFQSDSCDIVKLAGSPSTSNLL